MARRRSSTEGANMDSLMDTLTNVVGILIVILILAQVNAARSVKKIMSDLPPVTEQELAQRRKERAEAAAALQAEEKKLAERKKEPPRTAADLAKINEQIIQMERDIQKRKVPLVELDALTKKSAEQENLLAERRKEMDALLAEKARLLALLDATPAYKPPEAKVVRVPNSRPLPENANIQRFLAAGQRIYHIDHETGMKQILDDFNRVRKDLEKERVKRDGKTAIIYDQDKMVEFFATRKPRLRDVEATVMPNKPWTRLYLQFKPKPDAGESLEDLGAMNSRFQSLIRGIGSRTVVWFHVMPDSFETYLKARELTDQRGLPAGWEIAGQALFNDTIEEIEVNRLEEPKAPGPAPKIPAPKKSLD